MSLFWKWEIPLKTRIKHKKCVHCHRWDRERTPHRWERQTACLSITNGMNLLSMKRISTKMNSVAKSNSILRKRRLSVSNSKIKSSKKPRCILTNLPPKVNGTVNSKSSLTSLNDNLTWTISLELDSWLKTRKIDWRSLKTKDFIGKCSRRWMMKRNRGCYSKHRKLWNMKPNGSTNLNWSSMRSKPKYKKKTWSWWSIRRSNSS